MRQDSKPTFPDKALAAYVRDILTPVARPPVISMLDDEEKYSISIMVCVDSPGSGSTTLTTVSLHDHQNLVNGADVRAELILSFRGEDERLQNVLGSAGLNVAKDGWPLWPGVVYPNIVRDMAPGYACPHLLFTAPGTYPELARYQYDAQRTVHWLQAVPIHESERLFVQREGLDALEEALERADAQVMDLDRPAVV